MWIIKCVILVLICLLRLQLNFAQLSHSFTKGSCIKSGYTECQGGFVIDCYCDKACLDFYDCCTDIYQLDVCETCVTHTFKILRKDLCSYMCIQATHHIIFVGTECTSGSVRLVGGLRPYEGLVEVCIFQSWHPVCNSSFSYPEALVTCNWLGYTATLNSHKRTIQLLNNTTSIDSRTVYGSNCIGDESRLTECLVDFRYCVSSDEQATVKCIPIENSLTYLITTTTATSENSLTYLTTTTATSENSLTYLTTTTTSESFSIYPSVTVTLTETSVNCSNPGQIRLVDGYHQFDGRVEICINGEWGTVCNDLWDYNDAKVVCRQLGHSEVYAKAYNDSYFGEEVGQIKLHQVNCVGDESALLDCHYTIDSYDCYYYQAAGVECIGNSSRCSYYGELRLVGGESDNEGRVEICINGEWGTVCDDSWDNNDANVVCRQLGYSTNGALGQQGAHYGEGTGEIYLDEMGCSGNESNLLHCSHLPVGVHDCEHKEDAGVSCLHTSSYMEPAPLPIAQIAGITVGAVVILISLPTGFAILVMCYIRRKRLREKNTDLGKPDATSPEKLHIQDYSAYYSLVRHYPAPLYSNISEVVESPKVIDDENDYEIVL